MNNKTTQNDGFLTTLELADRLKVTVQAARKWAKAGCPIARLEPSAHGRPGMRFDLKAVRIWLVTTGKTTKAMLAAPAVIAGTAEAAHAPDTDKPVETPPASAQPVEGQSHFTAAIDRARKSEDASFRLWAQTLNTDKIGASAFHERYLKAAESLTRMERSKGEILLAEGSMMLTEQAFEATATVLKSIRIDLESLPNSVAPRLAGLTVPEIAALLREAVQDVLRHLHEGKTK